MGLLVRLMGNVPIQLAGVLRVVLVGHTWSIVALLARIQLLSWRNPVALWTTGMGYPSLAVVVVGLITLLEGVVGIRIRLIATLRVCHQVSIQDLIAQYQYAAGTAHPIDPSWIWDRTDKPVSG